MTTSAGTVLVAYLHSSKQIEHSFHTSLMAMVNYDAAHNQRLFASAGPLMMRAGTGGLVDARNKMMAHFLDQAVEEWLWVVDTDMGFAADTVDRLVEAADPVERPVVGGLCFGLRLDGPDGYGGYLNRPYPTIYVWDQDINGMPGFRAVSDYPREQLVPVAGTGAACLLVHRTAAEKVRAEHGDEWFTPVRYQDGRPVSEDLSFCYRLGRLGIPVHVDTRVKTTHAKQIWVGEPEFQAHQLMVQAATAAAQHLQADGPVMIPLSVRPADQRRPGVISIPLPSRNRPAMLAASIGSLRDTATRPDLLEILVAHDPDDPQTAETARALGVDVIWQAPQRFGYAGSAHYYAALLEQASGEWCLPSWGDDGLMLTPGWDDIVRAQPAPSILFTRGGDKWGNNCFPIVHMDVFTALGRFTDLPAIDTWYDEVGKLAGIWRDPGITLMQDRFDLTGNNRDETYLEGRSGYRAGDYYSPRWTLWRREDAARLADWVRHRDMLETVPGSALPVHIDTFATLADFRFAQGLGDILKHPDDLDRYTRIIEATRPEVIVETGTRTGASALWFASQPGVDMVITVDVNPLVWPEGVNYDLTAGVETITGDSADPMTFAKVAELVAGRRCMVSLDSAHTAEHVAREIELYGPLVTPGCYLVVEDGIFRYATPDKWIRHGFGDPTQGNPLDAIEAVLVGDPAWQRDEEIEKISPISHHPGGWWVKAGQR